MPTNRTVSPHKIETSISAHDTLNVKHTTCCIVGGGPAGAVLAFLLAREGIPVTLLEAHKDFDRDFRGDTIHPSTMEIMEELGLSDRLLQLPHAKIPEITFMAADGSTFGGPDFRHLKTRYPYIMMLPQVKFLEFITTEAQQYSNFHLVMGANVRELVEADGIIQGVRYREHGDWHEVRALVTVGADGRHSHLRELAGLEAIGTSPPMDVLWFRLPRKPEEPEGGMGRVGDGRLVAMLNRSESWQIAYIFPKGGYQQIRAAGLKALQQSIAEIVPELSEPYRGCPRVEHLQQWSQVAFLSVESDRLKHWYRPGLLLIGDAAHVMSPVGGVGINYAIQDAVVAANVLSDPLKAGNVQPSHLANVQRQREWPTRIIQMFQSLMQQQLITRALNSNKQFSPPILLRLPILRDLLGRLIGFGIWRVRVKT